MSRMWGTYTQYQLPARAWGAMTGIDFIDTDVLPNRDSRKAHANWQGSNFAVLLYVDLDNGRQYTWWMYNAGEGNHHSEEAIFNCLRDERTTYRPVALFTERQPCSGCMSHIATCIRSRARGYDVPIYYISPYPPSDIPLIRAWWQ